MGKEENNNEVNTATNSHKNICSRCGVYHFTEGHMCKVCTRELNPTPTLKDFTEKVTQEAERLYPQLGVGSFQLELQQAHIKARLMGFEEINLKD